MSSMKMRAEQISRCLMLKIAMDGRGSKTVVGELIITENLDKRLPISDRMYKIQHLLLLVSAQTGLILLHTLP